MGDTKDLTRTISIETYPEDALAVRISAIAQESENYGGRGLAEVWEAIGYLSWWNLTFPVVRIHVSERDPEITAYYSNADGRTGYVIGVILRDNGAFSFHS